MEWLAMILTIVFAPTLTLIGTAIIEKGKLKSKRMELDDKKNETIVECQKLHSDRLEKIKKEFNTRLDSIEETLSQIRDKQTGISFTVEQLQKDVAKHNGVIERTIILERDMAVLQNRESVSEHRLADLEKHYEEKKSN